MIESELMPLYNIYIIFNDLYPKPSASDIPVQAGRRVGQGCGHLGHHGGHLQETGGPYGRITHLNATVTVSDNIMFRETVLEQVGFMEKQEPATGSILQKLLSLPILRFF